MPNNNDREIYQPLPEVVEKAIVNNPEELAASAAQDLTGFWEQQASEFVWFSPGKKCWMIPISRFTNGLSAAKPTSPTTAWTGTSTPGAGTSWP